MAIDVGWVDSVWVKIVAGCFAGLASVLTLHQVYQHLRHFKNRRLQKYVCRILLMVPIYALSSFLPLVVGDKSFVVEKVKDCYEAFLIYTFLAYIFALLGEESDIVGRIQEGGMEEVPGSCINYLVNVLLLGGPGLIAFPLYRRFFPPWAVDGRFLQVCKRGTMQFVFLKPVLAVLEVVFFYTHLLHSGDFSPKYAYFYLMLIWNTTYGTALYYLALFLAATRTALQQYNPLLKFAVVKGIVFLTFWQGIAIAVLVEIGVLASSEHSDSSWNNLSAEIQNVLTCIEMLGFAIAHRFAFPYDEHTTSRLDGHLHDMGINDKPAAESDNGHQSERQPRRILSNALSALGNLLVVFNVVDLFEDGWRNFGSRYEGLTKISGGGDDDDAALGELEGESSDFAMLPNGNKVGGHGHPRSPSLDDDMDFEL